MKKNLRKTIQKKISRQHLVMTLVLAAALTLGAWLALVLPSELAAANEEPGHVHTFACYEGFERVCGNETHEHTFDCWEHGDKLVCGLAEGAAHVHGSDGWICELVATVLVCDQTVHTHDDSCYMAPVVVTPPEHSATQPGNSTQVPGPGDGDDGYIVITVPGVEESDTPAEPQEDGTPDDNFGGVAPDDDFSFGVGDEDSNPEDSSNNEAPSGGDNSGVEDPTAGDNPGPEDPSANDNQNSEVEPGDNAQTAGENQADNDNQDEAEPQAEDNQNDVESQTGNESLNEDTSANNDESNSAETAQNDGADQGEPAAQAADDGSSTAEAENQGESAPDGSNAFGLFHTVLADTYPPMNDSPQTSCNLTEHQHGEECYVEVYMCRKVPVINVPQLPTNGTVNLLEGVTVEPTTYNGHQLVIVVAEVSAVDAAGNEREANWDGEATLVIEEGLTYSITYIAGYQDAEVASFGLGDGFGMLTPIAELKATVVGLESGPAASIGDKTYDTLQKAIDNVTGDNLEVVLLRNVQENISNNGQNFVLNMDGHTITGTGTGSVVTINGGSVTLENGTITGGKAENGGGIHILGHSEKNPPYINIDNCTIENNSATSKGGGIYADVLYGATLYVSESKINDNKSVGDGGGIYFQQAAGGTETKLTIIKTEIKSNKANNGAGIAAYSNKWGDAKVYIKDNTVISQNAATKSGGGVFVKLDGNNGSARQMYINGGTITENTAVDGAGIYANKYVINAEAGVISNNTAEQRGGGVCLENGASIIVNGTNINNNTSNINGGGVYGYTGTDITVNGGNISGNIAAANGGGIYSTNGTLTIEDGVIDGNVARSDNSMGGGIYAGNGTVEVKGGQIGSQVNAIANADTDTVIGKPEAGQQVDGNYANAGGGIYIEKGILSINGGQIIGNTAFYNGTLSKEDYINGNGGGVYAASEATLNMHSGVISHNKAYSLPAQPSYTGSHNGTYNNGGGGIFAAGHILIDGNAEISHNYAEAAGGGVFLAIAQGQKASFKMHGGTISYNTANRSEGGGIFIGSNRDKNKLGVETDNEITAGTICNNKTNTTFDWGGGGIFVHTDAGLKIENALVTNNTALGFGGGVAGCPSGYVYLFSIDGAAVYDNIAEANEWNLTDREYGSGGEGGGNGEGKTKDRDAFDNTKFMHAIDSYYEAMNVSARYPNCSQDYFCVQVSFVSGEMLGGGDANWWGYCDDNQTPFIIRRGQSAMAGELMGLKSFATAEDKAEADKAAAVRIYGNTSNTHGGGIMSNGALQLGEEGPDAVFKLDVNKTLKDNNGNTVDLKNGQFKFQLLDSYPEGNVISTATNSVSTNGKPASVTFTISGSTAASLINKDKLYVVEVTGTDNNVNYDTSVYAVEVTIEEKQKEVSVVTEKGETVTKTIRNYVITPNGAYKVDKDGNKIKDTDITLPGGIITFDNSYKEKKPELGSLTIQKEIKGDELPENIADKIFKFMVTSQDGKKYPIEIKGAGSATLENLEPGKYTITEDKDSANVDGWICTVSTDGEVTVKKDETATVTITNTYTKQKPDTLTIPVSKNFTGRDVQDGDEFTFAILPSKYNTEEEVPMPGVNKIEVIQVDLNSGNTDRIDDDTIVSEFSFGPITFTKAGTYLYVIEETRPQSDKTVAGVTYDPALYLVTVKVEDYNGDLKAKVVKLERRETSSTGWETLKSDANGIELTAADIVFENSYSETEIDRYFRATKRLQGADLVEGQFTFVLTAEGSRPYGSTGNYVPNAAQPMPEDAQTASDGRLYREKTNGGGGFVTFNGIHFIADDAGSNPEVGLDYHYTIREKQPTVDGTYEGQPLPGAVQNEQGQWVYNNVTYDKSEKNLYVHVYVEDSSKFDEDGLQTAEHQIVRAVVHDSDREAEFTNTFMQPQLGRLTVGKQVVGPAPAGAEYTFNVTLTYPDGTEETRTLTMQAGETRTIENLPEGTTYTVKEEIPAGVNRIEYNYSDGENAAGASNSGTISAPGEADEVTVTNYYPNPENPNPENPTPGNPGDDNSGGDEPDLPNPNDPTSPDEVTIFDEGVPLTYVKVYEPETEEYVYLPEDEVPLAEMGVPQTGDESRTGWLALLSVLSLLGLTVLIYRKPEHKA